VKKGTPKDLQQKLNDAIGDISADPKLKASLTAQNQVLTGRQTLADAAKVYAAGTKQFKDIAKAINLQPQ
jgi:tripartite-type tricarboxylate transporter receptor subunit TctC